MNIRIIQSFVEGHIASRVGDQLTVPAAIGARLISDGFAVAIEPAQALETASPAIVTNRKKAIAHKSPDNV